MLVFDMFQKLTRLFLEILDKNNEKIRSIALAFCAVHQYKEGVMSRFIPPSCPPWAFPP
jgi:hypothetical protein